MVREALEAGAPAVQLRDKEAGGGELLRSARELRALTREHDALLFVNDRLDVALAAGADGVHVGAGDLPVASVRGAAPAGFLIGCSTDDPERAVAAERDGASYIGCGAVYGTSSKDVGGEVIGTARLAEVARAVSIPVVAIGGVTVARAAEVAASGAAGSAVIGAVMGAGDVASAVRALMAPFREWDGRPKDTSERRSDR